ncbi:hypothetical protein Enr10x_10080 [Gimesia panareensis]|uniref:Uncharacterized protein n=1 Tax=Gimesia panareensis TaxID=2527978 RepID=A0A517Q246_9PLAN|nr:hypothetical protein [Gimesia panareensis]QDT25711.1 hypothetical protein Enr10x_10080 [Gimesia panareensis]
MFRSKVLIYLCILLGTGLGWFHAHAYWITRVRYWRFSQVIDSSDKTICFWIIFGSALLAAVLASWKNRTTLWLTITGITVGWLLFALAGPAYTSSPQSTQQGLLPAGVIWEQLSRQTVGMLLGALVFLYWPEIARFLNSFKGIDSEQLTAPRSPSESRGSS